MRWRERHQDVDGEAADDGSLLLRLLLTRLELDGNPGQAKNLQKTVEQLPSALGRATVLVAADEGGDPLVGAGLKGTRVLRVFTDAEALEAWAAERAPGEAPVRPITAGELPTLDSFVKESTATTLVLNPAGPGGVALPAGAYRERSAPVLRAPLGAGDHPWLAPEGRLQVRGQLAASLDELAAVAERGDPGQFGPMAQDAGQRASAFGDLMSLARLLWLGCRNTERQGGPSETTAKQQLTMAVRWGSLGETTRCLQALLAAGHLLVALRARDPADAWAAKALDATLVDAGRIGGADHPDVATLREAAGR